MTKEEQAAFIEGAKAALYIYAWHKDGVMYVGTCGKTYKEAEANIEKILIDMGFLEKI